MTLLSAALLALFATAPSLAGVRVAVVADDRSRPYEDAIRGLVEAGAVVESWRAGDRDALARLRRLDGRVCLALGPKSAQMVARLPISTPRAAVVPRARDVPAGLAAVTLEVPLSRQLGWLAGAFPGRRRLLVLRTPAGARAVDDELRAAAQAAGFALQLIDVHQAGEAVVAAQDALARQRRGAILLLVPDPVAVTADTVAPLVQTSLAYRVPSVGFSSYFLRAGAMAAVVVDYQAAAVQAVALARLPQPRIDAAGAARLVVDGRLAERLGIAIGRAAGVEVNR